jgi:hypothetical protein
MARVSNPVGGRVPWASLLTQQSLRPARRRFCNRGAIPGAKIGQMSSLRPPAAALVAGLALLAGCGGATPVTAEPAHPPTATAPPHASPPAAPIPLGDPPNAAGAAGGEPEPAGACPLFPPDSVWHSQVTGLPVHPQSDRIIDSIGSDTGIHTDFGAGTYNGGPIGIPVTTVPAGTPAVRVSFEYGGESDPGPYPIPTDVRIENGGDAHMILHDPAGCTLYELFAVERSGDGWRAGSGAVFDLRSHRLRPAGWTSADAAGLPILPGLVRYEEVAAGRIDHPIRLTVPRSRDAYVWPARHAAGSGGDPGLPPMGLRLRLKASVDISGLPAQARVIAKAMQTHGLIVADNGSAWYISGSPDERWNNDALQALNSLRGNDFEAVDASSLMVGADSGAARR